MNDGDALMLWAKPQPGGAVAVLLVNNHPSIAYSNVKVELAEVGLDAAHTVAVRDIWSHTDRADVTGSMELSVPSRDSVFVLLTPKN
jgi:hypothetical protein